MTLNLDWQGEIVLRMALEARIEDMETYVRLAAEYDTVKVEYFAKERDKAIALLDCLKSLT